MAATHSAGGSYAQATTVAVGSWRAISLARFGPETTTNCSAGRLSSSVKTSDMNDWVDCSRPLISETRMAWSSMASATCASVVRACWAGTATTTISAPVTAATGSVVAVILDGSGMSSRYSLLVWLVLISSATSGRRAHKRMVMGSLRVWAASAKTLANVVPHDP